MSNYCKRISQAAHERLYSRRVLPDFQRRNPNPYPKWNHACKTECVPVTTWRAVVGPKECWRSVPCRVRCSNEEGEGKGGCCVIGEVGQRGEGRGGEPAGALIFQRQMRASSSADFARSPSLLLCSSRCTMHLQMHNIHTLEYKLHSWQAKAHWSTKTDGGEKRSDTDKKKVQF